jgi:hypothetical protein
MSWVMASATALGRAEAAEETPGWGSVVDSARDLLAPLLASLDADRLTGGDAVVLYRSFVAVERLAGAGKTLLAGRIADSGVWSELGHRDAAAFLAEVEGVSPGQARSAIEVGQRLRSLPATEDAVRHGTLSGPKVAELTGAGILDPSRESDLLAGAATEPLRAVRERCGRSRATSATADPIATTKRIRANRCFASWINDDGAFCYRGEDTADRGAQILERIGATASRLRAERTRRPDHADHADHDAGPERAVRADAVFALLTGVHPDGPGSAPGPSPASSPTEAVGSRPPVDPDLDPDPPDHPDDPGVGRRTGTSGDETAEFGTSGDDTAGSVTREPSADSLTILDRSPTCTTMVRIDLEALLRGVAAEGECCEIDGLGPIPVLMARDLMNDSFLRLVFHRAGDIRSVHHCNRTINKTLRTALVFRDTTCVVPGCLAQTRLEIDHVVPFTEGGPTTLDNLALLCHHHHFLKTFEGWVLERTGMGDDGRPTWRFEPMPPFGQEPGLGIDSPEGRDRWGRAQE